MFGALSTFPVEVRHRSPTYHRCLFFPWGPATGGMHAWHARLLLSRFSLLCHAQRGIVNRERASKSYHCLPYYLARFICDMPLRLGQGVLFGCIVYWIVGLNPSAAAFFIFW